MSMQDPIADMLTRIRNACLMNKKTVIIPHSSTKIAIAKVLQSEGYINGFTVSEDKKPEVNINLKYADGRSVIEEINRISRPSLKVYRSKNDLPKIKGGLGVAIISTSKGVMSGHKAHQIGLGGEVLCTVY